MTFTLPFRRSQHAGHDGSVHRMPWRHDNLVAAERFSDVKTDAPRTPAIERPVDQTERREERRGEDAVRRRMEPPASAPASAPPPQEAGDHNSGGGARLRGSFRDFKSALMVWVTGIAPGRVLGPELARKVGAESLTAYQAGRLTLEQLQYRAMDARGFIGYRFGEELLHSLGYYRPTAQALREWPVASGLDPIARGSRFSNRWDGQFTGLQGAFSLRDFATAGVQEIAVGEAFAWHLQQIIGMLPGEMGLGDLVGTRLALDPPPGARGSVRSSVEVTISGMLAAAQCYGAAAAMPNLLGKARPGHATAQSIHRMMTEFGGYATPYDAIPRPSDSDVGQLISRVRNRVDDPDWLR